MRLLLAAAVSLLLAAPHVRAQFQPPGSPTRRPASPAARPSPTPAAVKLPPTPPPLSPDDTTRLQIFLERENFAPGKLDGKPGEFTRKALARYAAAAHRPLPPPGPALLVALPAVREIQPYARYTVTAEDAAQVGPVPDDHVAQGRLKVLPYASLLELLGERFHASRDFLRQLNPGRNLDALAPGDLVRVPNVAEPLYVGRGVAVGKDGHLLTPRPEFRPAW